MKRTFFALIFCLMSSALLTSCIAVFTSPEVTLKTEITQETQNAQPTQQTEPQTNNKQEPNQTATPTATPTPEPTYVEPIMNETWYDGFVDPRSVRATVVEDPTPLDTLVNKYYTLPEDYVPADLVIPEGGGQQQLRKEAADAYEKLNKACKEAVGKGIHLVSGYRSYQLQITLFQRSCNKRSVPFACKRNAYQGRSEHQLGLAMDICPEGQSTIWDDFGETVPGKWVNEHCHEYGFIRRFQSQYSAETGYDNEAWHYRYVGVELATYLHDNDMSLESYKGKAQIMPYDE